MIPSGIEMIKVHKNRIRVILAPESREGMIEII